MRILIIGRDKPTMAHYCGFTQETLLDTLDKNGFKMVAGKRRPEAFALYRGKWRRRR